MDDSQSDPGASSLALQTQQFLLSEMKLKVFVKVQGGCGPEDI